MQIAELFINLGVKGNDKAVNALGSVQKGLGEVKSMSLEAKAGILAALYAFERLTVGAAQAGTGLKNFETLTGISAETLQRYKYAALQVGITNEEVEGSFKSLQTVMGAVRRGEGVPAGAKYLSGLIGGFDPEKLKDIPSMMQELQRASQANIDPAMKRWAMSTFGISEGMQVAMSRNAFRPDIMNKAPIRSEGMIRESDKVNIASANLQAQVGRMFDSFTVKHGRQIISDISQLTSGLKALYDVMDKIATKVGAFEKLGQSIRIISEGLKIPGMMFEDITNPNDPKVKKRSEDAAKARAELPQAKFVEWLFDRLGIDNKVAFPMMEKPIEEKITPRLGREPQSVKTQTFDTTVNMNFQHDGKDSVKTVNSVKDAVKQSYRQMSAQLQGS